MISVALKEYSALHLQTALVGLEDQRLGTWIHVDISETR